MSGEDERNGEGKIIEKVKERVRDREGQDVEGGEEWEARRGWWGESVHCDWNVSTLPIGF